MRLRLRVRKEMPGQPQLWCSAACPRAALELVKVVMMFWDSGTYLRSECDTVAPSLRSAQKAEKSTQLAEAEELLEATQAQLKKIWGHRDFVGDSEAGGIQQLVTCNWQLVLIDKNACRIHEPLNSAAPRHKYSKCMASLIANLHPL